MSKAVENLYRKKRKNTFIKQGQVAIENANIQEEKKFLAK